MGSPQLRSFFFSFSFLQHQLQVAVELLAVVALKTALALFRLRLSHLVLGGLCFQILFFKAIQNFLLWGFFDGLSHSSFAEVVHLDRLLVCGYSVLPELLDFVDLLMLCFFDVDVLITLNGNIVEGLHRIACSFQEFERFVRVFVDDIAPVVFEFFDGGPCQSRIL